MEDKTRTVVIWVVTFIWVLNFFLGWLVKDYQVSESVNAVFFAIITATFVSNAKRRSEINKTENKSKDGSEEEGK